MAWFTAATEPIENVFEAGTVDIEAGWQANFEKLVEGNWNPGDCSDLGLCVVNEGTKAVKLRAQFNGYWTPGNQRMLVIYTGEDIQLLTLDWDAFCKGNTGSVGPIAEGRLNLFNPYNIAYFKGVFTGFTTIKDSSWLSTGVDYSLWCVDSETIINRNTLGITGAYGGYDVSVYDPGSNPDWYDEVATNAKWNLIPWQKLNYIINQNYMEQGYTSDEMQDAIWHYTNGSIAPFHTPYIYTNLSAAAKEIVDDVNANSGLQPSNVSFSPGAGWTYNGADEWWYYDFVIPGTFTDPTDEEREVCIDFTFCLDGATTGNEYQGAHYHLISTFQAIQASHHPDSDSDVKWDWSEFNTYN